MDTAPVANYLGFLALICYVITLLPSILRIVFPSTKKTEFPKILLKYRRQIGVIAFLFAFGHGILLVSKRNFDFFDIQTYWIYIQGVVTFIIFTLLTITSNDWSIKRMKKNWKKLHELTYLAMFLLVWHVIDKMWGHWSYLTPLGIIGITGITVLFIVRRWIERRKKLTKTKSRN
ncbi:ferric reductase-like transmembrane domain-containing protein [Okeania sp. SIO2B3]|uniref:ferric reductase-like transmembrane domain-containing protein n=1 Tax=Okeania sp. SIO2B3 TaxID=2607784 RepID=UPI0013C07347|nr:ferric reductase-like transmembrane domain-containing protein [Okeania sp. SIO2B3]NET40988.1 iron reductase [Okeania sp. SIO2B3]